jgi:uncharacterized membrane protein YcaP (DUF421 family)
MACVGQHQEAKNLESIFFTNWESLFRTIVIGILAYGVLVVFLRISGKRTLSKMNAFDFIVTVALGSTLANVFLNKDISLADGAMAFALLIGLQFAVTWSSVRVQWVRKIVTGEPLMVMYRGNYLRDGMLKARITEAEVLATIRSAGLASPEQAHAVILETDGSMNVVHRGSDGDENDPVSLSGVRILEKSN